MEIFLSKNNISGVFLENNQLNLMDGLSNLILFNPFINMIFSQINQYFFFINYILFISIIVNQDKEKYYLILLKDFKYTRQINGLLMALITYTICTYYLLNNFFLFKFNLYIIFTILCYMEVVGSNLIFIYYSDIMTRLIFTLILKLIFPENFNNILFVLYIMVYIIHGIFH